MTEIAESRARTFAKSLSWQATGFVAMTALTWAVTGSWTEGSVVAGLGAALGFVSYFLHERAWARVGWGRQALRSERAKVAASASFAASIPVSNPFASRSETTASVATFPAAPGA